MHVLDSHMSALDHLVEPPVNDAAFVNDAGPSSVDNALTLM
jgi:hypothetical protein